MKAYVYEFGDHKLKEMPEPSPKANEVVVALKVAGLNRRDLYIANRLGPDHEALILGSDGAGVVEAIGDSVTEVKVGDEVIINPSLRWFEKSAAPPEGFEILGMPDHGTFAEKIVIDEAQVEPKPSYLSWEEAGVLALAALTGYRAVVTKANVKKGDTVFIPGAGSGVATYMIQFAHSLGAKVITTSRDKNKREEAKKIGANLALDTASNWEEELKDETIDIVIDSIGAATFNRSLNVLKQGGMFVLFGATAGDEVQFNLREFFYGQFSLLGTTMGSREELREMLSFIERNKIKPVVGHTYPFDEIDEAFKLLEVNDQFGKIAVKI
ncbi:MAG TPA: zinc-binding dehydrogenase [Pseudogracilibacillus sp.]|nr:zinc-binding dehydrogenase [Pseudogracilibacillus sp.]